MMGKQVAYRSISVGSESAVFLRLKIRIHIEVSTRIRLILLLLFARAPLREIPSHFR